MLQRILLQVDVSKMIAEKNQAVEDLQNVEVK